MNIPCVSKSVLPVVVAAVPSGPPSRTLIVWVSTFARLLSCTDVGTTAFAVVLTPHVEPIVPDAVLAHVAVTGNARSDTVAGSVHAPHAPIRPLKWYAIRICVVPFSSPE